MDKYDISETDRYWCNGCRSYQVPCDKFGKQDSYDTGTFCGNCGTPLAGGDDKDFDWEG